MNPLILGFFWIFIAAVAGGAFGLQYRVMRHYQVENASLLSVFVATVPIPLIACWFLLPGWTTAISRAGFNSNMIIFFFGFCWGMGAITYAYGFNLLGMALAASLLKGISIAIGSGVPLFRHWNQVSIPARVTTILGLLILMVGTAVAGKAGILREKETQERRPGSEGQTLSHPKSSGRLFWIGFMLCLISGFASSGANLGFDRADVIEKAMVETSNLGDLTWKATLVRWMPMYWGGISALLIFMGGAMVIRGTWRCYFAEGSLRDFAISSSMGVVHFMAQIPYGIGAYYLGKLGTTIGWGANIGMALIVASALGFLSGEWKGASKTATHMLYYAITILIGAIIVLATANSLA
ncbi:MAG: L-rhamnose/proton symporter RhaT [Terriglobia bacterium]